NNNDGNNSNNNKNNDNNGQELEDYTSQLIKDYMLKTLDDTDIYWYNSKRGVFLPNAEPIIKAKIEKNKGKPYVDKKGKMKESSLTTYEVNEYIGHIQRRTYIKREEFNPHIEWLACNNCVAY
ncbi:MAG TPA: hypothetical protein VFJ51_14390, partial [Nitrososphaeraceae archaeon]|nr:hypothetical protein [Nitrososphaeraceae archaeon]